MSSSTELLVSMPSITLSYPLLPTRPQFLSHTSSCMDTSLEISPLPNLSLERLSSELIALVLEQLREIDSHTLTSVRLVSKRFDAIATPIFYRYLALNERLIVQDAQWRYPNAFHHISRFTNHVTVRSNLEPGGIAGVLSHVRRLKSVRTQLYIDNLPLRRDMIEVDAMLDVFTESIPAKFLTSLKLANTTPVLSTRLNSLKRLLIEASRLSTLQYEDRGQGTCFNFLPKERMPALTDLRLRSYDWRHTAEDVRKHWDFSRIQSLELVSVPIFNFLSSVCFQDFSRLHTLHAEDYSAHLSDKREDATAGLNILVKDHIKALETLNITCHTELFQMDAITAHQHSLQVLRFRDHVGFSEDDQKCPTLAPDNLLGLSQHLKRVHTLELDMDVRLCDPAAFLRAICAFPSIHTLTLHVPTMIQPLEEIPPGIDRDYEAAIRTFKLLLQEKERLGAHTPWRHIAVNVGGWKRVMVRRLGGVWRRRNEMGIYAERCFVLERDAQNGKVGVREEVCVENTSRGGSPTP
ncbi:hypothetical protein F66182_8929 [Fusarium sp. NRRL 66182]|nr:hypothetical protein F66182_8929 [Fusarium sp. NRRL 66182]